MEVLWAIFFSPLFAVRAIEVEGTTDERAAQVRERLEQFQGVPLTRLSAARVEEEAASLPQVAGAHAAMEPRHTLRVELTERVPVAAVSDGDGWALIDAHGDTLDTVGSHQEAGLPRIEGEQESLDKGAYRRIGAVLSTLPKELLTKVSAARADSDSSVLLELEGGEKVRWGDSSDSALKSRVLQELMDHPEQVGQVSVYDVSSPEHPVLT